MDRRIVCFAIPSFEIAVARQHDPSLATRPLAIASPAPRSWLRAVSREAEQEGLHVGMPLDRARRLCPSLRVCPPDDHHIQRAIQSLLTVIGRYAPLWEPVQPGVVLLDVTGTRRLFGPAIDVAAAVQRAIVEHTGLEGQAGVGSNPLVAQTAAALVKPSELYEVRPGAEQAFLAPLPVRALPGLQRPCMRPVLARLDELNLRAVGDVAASPLAALEVALGDYAEDLWHWAHGLDPVPVRPPAAQPSLEEIVTVEPDDIDDAILWGRLQDGLQRLCRALRRQRRVCGSVTLTLRYRDHVVVTHRAPVHPETCWEVDLAPVLRALFCRSFRRRVRLGEMIVALTRLTAHVGPGALFAEPPSADQRRRERAQRLAVALDQLQAKFGERAIRYGRRV